MVTSLEIDHRDRFWVDTNMKMFLAIYNCFKIVTFWQNSVNTSPAASSFFFFCNVHNFQTTSFQMRDLQNFTFGEMHVARHLYNQSGKKKKKKAALLLPYKTVASHVHDLGICKFGDQYLNKLLTPFVYTFLGRKYFVLIFLHYIYHCLKFFKYFKYYVNTYLHNSFCLSYSFK